MRLIALDDLDDALGGPVDDAPYEVAPTYSPTPPDASKRAAHALRAVPRLIAPDEMRNVLPTDEAALRHIAQHVAHPRFWTDDMLVAPLPTFAYIFANPSNFVVTFGPGLGDGVAAYVRSAIGWRAAFYGLTWGRAAMRRPDLWRTATRAAFKALKLVTLDGVTAWDNTLARRCMEQIGFTFRDRLPEALMYRGVPTDGAWYELSRHVVEHEDYLTG